MIRASDLLLVKYVAWVLVAQEQLDVLVEVDVLLADQ